jgi:hypothetical protein
MDRMTLRETQAPLKQRYRDDPAAALTPLHATAAFEDDGITCTVRTWAGPVRAGLHPATGGDGAAWQPPSASTSVAPGSRLRAGSTLAAPSESLARHPSESATSS